MINTTLIIPKRVFLGPALGMALPIGLGLDYLYNKHIKYKNNPYYSQQLTGFNKYKDKAGKFIVDNPGFSILGGTLAGGVGQAAMSGLGIRRRALKGYKERYGIDAGREKILKKQKQSLE